MNMDKTSDYTATTCKKQNIKKLVELSCGLTLRVQPSTFVACRPPPSLAHPSCTISTTLVS